MQRVRPEDPMKARHLGQPVYLARNAWHLQKGQDDWPDLRFRNTRGEVA